MKIYIIGPVGSGKTTLSKKLSKNLGIKNYELDKVVWDDINGNIKRNPKKIEKLFNNIINNDDWIIEDVGRKCFKLGVVNADIVYYINLNRFILYFRIIKRWIKQKLNLEKYNYKPTIKSLFESFGWLHNDLINRKNKINELKQLNSNVIVLNNRLINTILKVEKNDVI